MSVNIVAQSQFHDCVNVTKVTVDGADFSKLKKLIADVLNGTNDGVDDDGDGIANENEFGLLEIDQIRKSAAGNVSAHEIMGVDTVAVAQWLSKSQNRPLYDQLKLFGVAPRVTGCKLGTPEPGKKNACSYISDSNYPASPDVLYDSVKLLQYFAQNASATSVTYYIYGIDRPDCSFFSHHEGNLTFQLTPGECSATRMDPM